MYNKDVSASPIAPITAKSRKSAARWLAYLMTMRTTTTSKQRMYTCKYIHTYVGMLEAEGGGAAIAAQLEWRQSSAAAVAPLSSGCSGATWVALWSIKAAQAHSESLIGLNTPLSKYVARLWSSAPHSWHFFLPPNTTIYCAPNVKNYAQRSGRTWWALTRISYCCCFLTN